MTEKKRFKGREYFTGSDLWRYEVGTKGINLVKVYEREKEGALHVEYWVPGPDGKRKRRREGLANSKGERVFDRGVAMAIADHMSDRQWDHAHATTKEEILGIPMRRTIEGLLDELHEARSADWSRVHKTDQKRLKTLWLATLGKDADLRTLNDALVAKKARDVAAAKKWSPRRHQRFLGYMREAFNFAADELKWLKPHDKLTAAKGPKVRARKDRDYSVDEVQKLLAAAIGPAKDVDPRTAAAVAIACMTGRRLNAIRTLHADAYTTEKRNGEIVGVIEFPAETDKAREEGRAYLRGSLREIVDQLAARSAVKASGKLFPAGDLKSRAIRRPYAAATWLTDQLHELEATAKVDYIERRAYHGFKKFFATVVEPHLAADQSGTDEATLRRHYRSASDGRRMEAAGQVMAVLKMA